MESSGPCYNKAIMGKLRNLLQLLRWLHGSGTQPSGGCANWFGTLQAGRERISGKIFVLEPTQLSTRLVAGKYVL